MSTRIMRASKMSCRQGVFETNSSSMHSLVVLKEASGTMPQSDNWHVVGHSDGTYIVDVSYNHYGRAPFAFLSHPIDKFLYILASQYGCYSDDDEGRQAFLSQMVEKLDGCTGFEFPNDSWRNGIDYGSVDHQSSGVVWRYIQENALDPFDFIFDDKSVIIVDGDEYGIWDKMKKNGLVDKSNIAYDLEQQAW